jgi:cyclic pyranopterin phosphate synthase
MFDAYGRRISYLRISVTDRCNLRCIYCMPEEGVPWEPRRTILSYEEITHLVAVGAEMGLRKIRLTGGEPLVRPHLPRLVQQLAQIPGIEEITLTTNGVLLPRYAYALAEAGLCRVNVSLDTLRPDRFHRITRWGEIDNVWRGIEAAEAVGLAPLKINMVIIRGFNDDEVIDMAALSLENEWHIRFIEWMPVGLAAGQPPSEAISVSEIQKRLINHFGALTPTLVGKASGPASMSKLPGSLGSIGFISPVSQHFCDTCNRLRLTADGKLRPCLLSDCEVDVREALRQGAGQWELKWLYRRALQIKSKGHNLALGHRPEVRLMAQIGG